MSARSIIRSRPHWLLTLCLICLALGVDTARAQPAQKIRLGYLRTYAMLPLFQAVEQGYFTAHGLDVELNVLNNGPAVASAVQSGSLDVGYAATIPIAAARSRGQDFRFFAAAAYQSAASPITMYIASRRSGVRSFADIAGKTVAVNAAGGGCELGVQDHAEAAGVPWRNVKLIIVPFPQIQAALELGNADVACIVDPFYSAIMASEKIGARVVATGPVANLGNQRVMVDGFFAREGWLQNNTDKAVAFVAALQAGAQDLQNNPARVPQLLMSALRFPEPVAHAVKFTPVTDMTVHATDLKPLIDAMKRRHFIDVNPAPDVLSESLRFSFP